MSNVPEEIQKTVANLADAMKSNPSCLAVVLLTALFLLIGAYSLEHERNRQQQRYEQLFSICFSNPTAPPETRAPPL